ncbi:MAG: TolB family protein [Sporichthyaceae bacterium]
MRSGRPKMARAAALMVVAGTLTTLAGTSADAAIPGLTELVSANRAGVGAAGLSSVGSGADLSADGRYVVFASGASDVVKQASTGNVHVYLRDRDTAKTLRVDPTPKRGRGDALSPAISANGRFVSFSARGALLPEDTNGKFDVYVRDLLDGTLTRASNRPDGAQTAEHSFNEDLSADGRYLLIRSADVALTGPESDSGLFVLDRSTGVYSRMDVSTAGAPAQEDLLAPIALPSAISPNGRFVAFTSTAFNLVDDAANLCPRPTEKAPDQTGVCTEVFLRDRDADTDGVFDEPGAVATTLVSKGYTADPALPPILGDSRIVGQGSVADDGSVALLSNARGLGAGKNRTDAFLAPHSGAQPTLLGAAAITAVVSGEGRFVAYSAAAADGVQGKVGKTYAVWMLDRITGLRERVSVTSSGGGLKESSAGGAITPGGRHVLFSTFDRAMLRGNAKKYRQENVFLRDRGVPDLPAGQLDRLVHGGEVLTTDANNEGATEEAPVQTEIAVPEGVHGTVRVVPNPVVRVAQYDYFGKRVSILAPPTAPANPYSLTFTADAAALAGMPPQDVQVFRYGTRLGACATAQDNPCIVSAGFAPRGDGDVVVQVRTSEMGDWTLGRNRAPALSAAAPSPAVLENPDGTMRSIRILGVTDADGDAVRITVVDVTQDEPVGALSFGEPDAVLGPAGSGRVSLRAERATLGDGRVYVVTFVATDSAGKSSTGRVRVSVPRPITERPAVDSGQGFTSH